MRERVIYKLYDIFHFMKELKCLDCEKTFKAENPDGMMKAMMPHYMEDHKDIMKGTGDEGKDAEAKKVWMEKLNKNWEEAKEI